MTRKSNRKSSCHRHPGEPITGFCAPCLTERLSSLDPAGNLNQPPAVISSLPELRRSKSSAGKNPDLLKFEPRRRSCDCGEGRNAKLGFYENVGTLFEGGDEVKEEEENDVKDEVFEDVEENVEYKTMKEHIDLEWGNMKQTRKDFKNIAGNIRNVASVFGKKLLMWRRKEKVRMESSGDGCSSNMVATGVEKVNGNHFQDTQMENGHYGLFDSNMVAMGVEKVNGNDIGNTHMDIGEYRLFGRRSCDTDPRVSLDGFGPKISFEKPRASCDGYFLSKALPRLSPMVCVFEDGTCIKGEDKINNRNEVEMSPGGSIQTRDYYSDPLSRRRRSFDRSCSYKKATGLEIDEMKFMSNNLKVSPARVELFHGAKVLITKNDLRNLKFSLKDDQLEELDCVSNGPISIMGGGDIKGFNKFGRWRKGWTMRGLKHK